MSRLAIAVSAALRPGQTPSCFPGTNSVSSNQSVLQIVDAQLGRLRESHRAQMAGDLQPARMRVVDRRLQLFGVMCMYAL